MGFVERQIERLKQEKYHGNKTEEFLCDADRLRNGEPYEYVLGYVDFLGTRIDLSYKPMIPRPETAFWVSRAIEELKQKEGALRLADTFSGAGNVGVALLMHLPNATVDFSELDPNLKAQIEKNIELNGIALDRTHVVTASALEGLIDECVERARGEAVRGASEHCDQSVDTYSAGASDRSNKEMHLTYGLYDAIFAVPPYVPYDALTELDPEMIHYEPHLAFFAHEDGHEFHRVLIEEGRKYLKDGGTLYMEADMDHNDAIRKLARGTAWSHLEFWPDPYGATPNVVLRK